MTSVHTTLGETLVAAQLAGDLLVALFHHALVLVPELLLDLHEVQATGLAGRIVTAGSYGAWQWLQSHPQWAASGHSHGDERGDDHAHDKPKAHDEHAMPAGPQALVVSRSIEVRMDDQMRFTPSSIEVRAGETIRFVVHNAGKTEHEMVLGSDADIREHAQAMQQGQAHHDGHSHGTGAAITVPAGQKGELVVRFDQATTLQMACLIPGHYEAGMRGTITVKP